MGVKHWGGAVESGPDAGSLPFFSNDDKSSMGVLTGRGVLDEGRAIGSVLDEGRAIGSVLDEGRAIGRGACPAAGRKGIGSSGSVGQQRSGRSVGLPLFFEGGYVLSVAP
jgi:hypothetical protein